MMRQLFCRRLVRASAILLLLGCDERSSCRLQTDELSRDQTRSDGHPYFIANLQVGSENAVTPGSDIRFSVDVERLNSTTSAAAVGLRIVPTDSQIQVLYAYPAIADTGGRVTGTVSGLAASTQGATICGDFQLVRDPNVTQPGGNSKPLLSNALPFTVTVR